MKGIPGIMGSTTTVQVRLCKFVTEETLGYPKAISPIVHSYLIFTDSVGDRNTCVSEVRQWHVIYIYSVALSTTTNNSTLRLRAAIQP